MTAREEKIEALKKLLLDRGIRMNVGACGCCDSPWIWAEVDGKEILREERARFKMDETREYWFTLEDEMDEKKPQPKD